MFLMKTFMSIVLSIIFLVLRDNYPLKTNNTLALEVCVIGIPSFFLALQSNKNIIKGKFLANVTVRAVPGGVALVLGIMAMYTYARMMGLTISSNPVPSCMMVYTLTCVGIMVLFKQCEPFNIFRTVLMIGTILFTALFMYVVPLVTSDGLGLCKLNITEICFVSTCVLASYFVVSILMHVLGAIKVK